MGSAPMSDRPATGLRSAKRELVLDTTAGNQIAVIPSLSSFASTRTRTPIRSVSKASPKKEVKAEPTASQSQSVKYDYKVIADAQRRHKRIIDGIEAALEKWQPTIHAGSDAGTAIECPAPIVPNNSTKSRNQAAAHARTSSKAPGCEDVEDTYIPDPYQQAAISAAEAGESFFLTGSAGTGKSFVLKKIIKLLRRKGLDVAVTASTGCAAVAINGNTVHSTTGVGLGLDPPEVLRYRARTNSQIREQLNAIDVLVIDEVSMIDSYLFDKIELMFSTARATRGDKGERRRRKTWSRKRRRASRVQGDMPFGGVQVIACGDFFQLPPVAASDYELQYTNEKYFAFAGEAWKKTIKKTIMLRVVHRQSDRSFVGMLNEIRHGVVSECTSDVLEACRISPCEDNLEIKPNGDPMPFTKLFSHRKQVDMENYTRLHKIKDYPGVMYIAKDVVDHKALGSMSKSTAEALLRQVPGLDIAELKERCRVLCLKNIDREKGIVNGSAGYIVGFQLPNEKKQISVEEWEEMTPQQRQDCYAEIANNGGTKKVSLRDEEMREKFKNAPRDSMNGFYRLDGARPDMVPVVRFDNGVERAMFPQRWDIYGPKGTVVAWRDQIPLMLGWALSIHKSQGMSLEHVQTELARAFDFGQVYVALSRARSVQGLRLTSFDRNKVMTHDKVVAFYAKVEQEDARRAAKRKKSEDVNGAWEGSR